MDGTTYQHICGKASVFQFSFHIPFHIPFHSAFRFLHLTERFDFLILSAISAKYHGYSIDISSKCSLDGGDGLAIGLASIVELAARR